MTLFDTIMNAAQNRAMQWAWSNGFGKDNGISYGEDHWGDFLTDDERKAMEG